MISSRGVAKKRRAQGLAGMTVKSSLGVAGGQQSWRGGNHFHFEAVRLNRSSRSSTTRPSHNLMRLFRTNRNRQVVDRLETGPPAPCNFRLIHRQGQFGPPPEQRFQRASTFNPRELMAKAEMDPGAEGD